MRDRLTAGLAVLAVQGAGFGVVSVGKRVLAEVAVNEGADVVRPGIIGVKLYGHCVVVDGSLVFA